MDNSTQTFSVGLFIGIISFFMGMWVGNIACNAAWRRDAIDCGVGHYNATNGQFYFKTNFIKGLD